MQKTTKRLLSLAMALLMVFSLVPAIGAGVKAVSGADLASVPTVRNVTAASGTFTLTSSARFYIVSDSDPTGTDLGTYVQTVSSEFAAKGLPSGAVLPIVYGPAGSVQAGDIVIKTDSSVGHAQGYDLVISGDNITVTGNDALGALYGLQTVLQSMVSGGTTLNCCTASDWPDVSERSLYIDCGRVLYSADLLKSIIRTLSYNKMTTLYLDFSNNNATRFFLDEMSVTAGGKTYDLLDAAPSDGYLTQSDMDGVLAEAEKYGVEVIPSFNSPGHIGGLYSLNNDLFDVGTATDYDSECGKITLDISKAEAWEFGVEVVKLYAGYFAEKGCKHFNIAADEATLGNVNYDSTNATFVNYVNALNTEIKALGMSTRMFNDGVKSADSGISTDIDILYWAPDGSADGLISAGYNIVNFSYGAGLYYAYLGSINGWWVWNQDASQLYSSWTPGVLCRDTSNSSSYVATETTDITNAHFLGANFAVWSDYAFRNSLTGDAMFAQNSYSMMQKILIVAERGWSTSCTKTYSEWQSSVTTAPGGVTIAAAKDTTALPAPSGITAAVTEPVIGFVDPANPSAAITGANIALGSDSVVTFSGLSGSQYIEAASNNEEVVTASADGNLITLSPVGEGTATVTATVKSAARSISDGTTYDLDVTVYDNKLDVPEYEAGTVAETAGGTEYVLDSNGVDSGSNYLIVYKSSASATSGYALTGTGDRDAVTISGTAVDASTVADNNSVWTFTQSSGSSYYVQNVGNSYYLYPSYSGVSTTTQRTATVSGTSTVTFYGSRYLRYNNGFTSSNNRSTAMYLYKQTDAAPTYTVSVANLESILTFAKDLTPGEYSNWDALNIDGLVSAAESAKSAVANPYSSQTDAQSAQDAVNAAAKALRDALVKLTLKKTVAITVSCVDGDGAQVGSGSYVFYAYENGAGGYDYDITPPTISGYSYASGGPLKGTVTEASAITLVYEEKSFSIENSIEIPITMVDYRADGLLFDHSVSDASYGYSLVHTHYGDTYNSASTAIAGTALEFLQLGGHRTGTNPLSGNGSYTESTAIASWNGTTYYHLPQLGCFARTGLVESALGANGMPVYTTAAVQYVADMLSDGTYNSTATSASNNWNDILYNTFLKSSSSRSILGTSTTSFSDAFANTRTYANIANAYDLAWYLLNTLYTGDANTASVTDYRDSAVYDLPIYGMETDVYNKLILIQGTDSNGETYYYLDAYDSTQSHVVYDTDNKAIYNVADGTDDEHTFFYPLSDYGYDAYLGDTTDMQYGGNDSYYPASANGNYTLKGEAQFVYREADDLYFTFSGDDDVYLYINGVLALDLGGAHWPLVKTVNLNDVKEQCGLVDGQVATFTFFYMERNADASNFSIKTNLTLVERGIDVQKTAYSATDSVIPDGSVIENGTTAYYDLAISNKGNQTMSQITFTDSDDNGGSVSFGYGVTNPAIADSAETPVKMGSSAFTLYVTAKNGTEVDGSRQTFDDLAALSQAVGSVTLNPGQTLHVRFLTASFNVPAAQMTSYLNKVTATAVTGGVTLTDSDSHQLYSYNVNDTARDYVVDFGIPMTADSLFSESAESYIADKAITLNKDTNLKYGSVTLSGTGYTSSLTYTMDKMIEGVETIVLDVTYKFGTTELVLQKVVRIIPASTVYYEDSYVTFSDGWTPVGTTIAGAVQNDDLIGDVNANVYGYDGAYAGSSQYSLGSAMKFTASGETYGTASFTFAGTGFDVVGLTSSATGTIVVNVTNDSGFDKYYLVDTYYGYTYNEVNGKWEVSANSDTLYQVPVMKVENLEYGTYTATVTVTYGGIFDHTGSGSYDFYFDAVRIYDPAGAIAADAPTNEQKYISDAYVTDGEGWASYAELRNMILEADTFNGSDDADFDGAVFIDGNPAVGEAAIADYKNYGPNNELYLAPGQAVAFNLTSTGSTVADIMVGLKTTSGSAEYAIYNAGNTAPVSTTINTATDMYYSIKALENDTIIIQNTGKTGILSVTNIKTTYTEKPVAPFNLFTVNYTSARIAVMSVQAVNNPVTVFEPETFSVSLNRTSAKVGQNVTVTITTSADVDSVTVNGTQVTNFRTNRRTGVKTWTAYVTPDSAGEFTIETIAFNAEGTASEPVVSTLTVSAANSIGSIISSIISNIFSKLFG